MPLWAPALALFAFAVTPVSSPVAIVTSNDAALDDALARAAPKLSSPIVARDIVKHAEREAAKLGLKCSADDAACNAKIGVLAGASAVIVPKPVGATFTLALVDVAAGKELSTAGPFSKKSDALTALQTLLSPGPPPPPVLVHADPPPVSTTTTTTTPATTTTTPTPTVVATAPTTSAPSLFWPLAIGAGGVGVVAVGCGVGAVLEDVALYDPKSTPAERGPQRALGQNLTYTAVGAGIVAAAVGAVAFAFAAP